MKKQPITEALAKECELRFQSGGPRVFTLESDGRILPSSMSASAAARCAFPDQTVLARLKHTSGRYVWQRVVPS